MDSEIIRYLSNYMPLDEELKQVIEESSMIKHFQKGTILLRQGDRSNECYLVLKGCIKSYVLKDGSERIIEFYTEEQPVSPITYGTNVPSDHFLECIEDTIATVSTPEMETEMLVKYPRLESVCRAMSEVMLSKQQQTFTQFKTNTPEERYLELLKNRGDLVNRLPQTQIASYLGITPESLSRIRKRLTKIK